jgi:hypothetical protein
LGNEYKILVGKPEGRDQSELLGVDGRIILIYILGKYGWRVWIGFIWLSLKTCGGIL